MVKNKAFTLNEIIIILVLIGTIAYLVVPKMLEDNKRLEIVSKWKNTYKNIEYVFSAMSVQTTNSGNYDFMNIRNYSERESFIYDMLTPYLRLQKSISSKDYKTYYLDGSPVKSEDKFHFNKLHTTNVGTVVGLKWFDIPERLKEKYPISMMLVDINGLAKPNKWGYDVFGVNIFHNRIEPVGKNDDEAIMRADCSSRSGKGISCSYYYYIYGGKLN